MTSKERVYTSLAWQEPDRPPIQIYVTPEIDRQLVEYFGGRDYRKLFGVDFWSVGPAYRGAPRPQKGDLFYDEWGVGYKAVQNTFGTYHEATDLALARIETLEDVERYPWPRIEDYDFSLIPLQCELAADYAICFGSAGMPDIVNGVSRGRGMEQVLMDIASDDPVGMAIIRRRVDFYLEYARRGLEAGQGKIDILCIGEDCGTQNGRLVSPEVFDRVFRPVLSAFIDLGHAYGAKVMMHSCGDTHEIMPTFIEMGLDVLDAMQPEPPGMEVNTIRALCKGRLAFCGLVSTQDTLPHKSEAECRAEARHRLDVIARGGGYIFSPAHCIQPDTPLRNVLAIYEEATGQKFL